MENVGYSSANELLAEQHDEALESAEVSCVGAPLDQPASTSNLDENGSNVSSLSSFDDDINDKDYQIDELPKSDSDSESESKLDDEDFDVINQEVKDKSNVIILNNIQIKKPNLPQTDDSLSSRLKNQKDLKTRRFMCIFCKEGTISKNFVRHLTRKHSNEKEVRKILSEPLNSKRRKQLLATLRKETTFERFLDGETLPARRNLNDGLEKSNEASYYPCKRCKGLYKKSYLRKHVKLCTKGNLKDNSSTAVLKSQTFTACQLDQTNTVARLEVKEEVFDLMRGDEIAFVAKKDLLITYFGNWYLKKHRKKKHTYTSSNKMREFGRLLLECRKLMNDQKIEMQNLLRLCHFDTIVTAARNLSGYDLVKKSFAAPSLALHYGGNLKLLCEELYHLAIKDTKGFKSRTSSEKTSFLKDIKNMKQLIISRWNIEMASLANKD